MSAAATAKQYPGEKEITFPPFTCLESDGDPRVERNARGEVVIFPLKVLPPLSRTGDSQEQLRALLPQQTSVNPRGSEFPQSVEAELKQFYNDKPILNLELILILMDGLNDDINW